MCEYFILSKQNNFDITNDEKNQIICLKEKIYILPSNNINYYIKNSLYYFNTLPKLI